MNFFSWFSSKNKTAKQPSLISVTEAHERARRGDVLIIDVRQPNEWARTGRPQNSVGVPFQSPTFVQDVRAAVGDKIDTSIALSCHTGARATTASGMLTEDGFTSLFIVEGGFVAWDKAGLPIDEGPF